MSLFWIFEYQRVKFCEACVFSLAGMNPLFQKETSPFNRRLLSSKRDATTNVQYAMFNVQCSMRNVHCLMFNAQCSMFKYILRCDSVEHWKLNIDCWVFQGMFNTQCSMLNYISTIQPFLDSARFSTPLETNRRPFDCAQDAIHEYPYALVPLPRKFTKWIPTFFTKIFRWTSMKYRRMDSYFRRMDEKRLQELKPDYTFTSSTQTYQLENI